MDLDCPASPDGDGSDTGEEIKCTAVTAAAASAAVSTVPPVRARALSCLACTGTALTASTGSTATGFGVSRGPGVGTLGGTRGGVEVSGGAEAWDAVKV